MCASAPSVVVRETHIVVPAHDGRSHSFGVARAFAVLPRGEDVVRRLRRAEYVTRKSLLCDRSEWILLVGYRMSLSTF